MTKEILEKQLSVLREKWKVYPKSYLEPNWWKFKCDKCLAIQIKEQIRKNHNLIEQQTNVQLLVLPVIVECLPYLLKFCIISNKF